jgi:hypothetical protein
MTLRITTHAMSLLGCWLAMACAADTGQGATGGRQEEANFTTGESCPAPQVTAPCECSGTPGRQTCLADGAWGLCECTDPAALGAALGDVPANRGEADFPWPRTAAGSGGGGGACEPGIYAGKVEGTYASPALCEAAGFASDCGLPVPIASVDVPGVLPGFNFELGSIGNGERLAVKGGKLSGNALAIFPFEADIADGELDCASGLFKAKLVNGTYTVPISDPPYIGNFEGFLVARYDAATRSFVDGVWSVGENGTTPTPAVPGPTAPALPFPGSGGTGTWTAMKVP